MTSKEFFDLVDHWSLEKRKRPSLEILVRDGRADEKVLLDNQAKIDLLEMGIHAECERVEHILNSSHETRLNFDSNNKKV